MTSAAIFIPGIVGTAQVIVTISLQLYITKLIWWYVLDCYNTLKLSKSRTFVVKIPGVHQAVK